MISISFENNISNIPSGYLIAWGGTTFFSKIVRIFTRSSFSHVGISIEFGGKLFVLEAKESKGVQLVPLSLRIPFYLLIPSKKCEVYEWNEKVERLALDRVGEKYSFLKCIKAFFKKKLKRNKKWECAEFASYILRLMGYNLKNNDTPQHLVDEMLSLGFLLVKTGK